MKTRLFSGLALALTATAIASGAVAQDIEEFRIGILGGENAQDRMNSYACLQDYAEEALGVPIKLFAPADYNGVIQGLLGGTLDMAWLGASGYAAVYLEDPEAVTPALVAEAMRAGNTFLVHNLEIYWKPVGVLSEALSRLSVREASVAVAAETGISRRHLYARALELKSRK